MKQSLISIAKWSWFGLLMLVAFGYMASGLSDQSKKTDSAAPEATETRLAGSETSQEAEFNVQAKSSQGSQTQGSQTDGMQRVIDTVNRARTEQLAARGLTTSQPTDWMTNCRRISLALVGSGVSLEEIRSLEKLPKENRESAHLKRLLRDPRFHDYWAERWTRYIVGADEGPFIVYRRRRFRHWLSDQLASNRPYDQIVRDLITAEGLWTDRPEVNFLTVTFDSNDGNPDPIRLAARTSRAFLGLRIDCLQCHKRLPWQRESRRFDATT